LSKQRKLNIVTLFFLPDTSHPGEEVVDLGYLYGFIQELKNLCVSGVASRLSPCQELISNQAFDISLFKSLEKLQVGLPSVTPQLRCKK
jgi:uncharacterized protein YfkK (UPF0435 family)